MIIQQGSQFYLTIGVGLDGKEINDENIGEIEKIRFTFGNYCKKTYEEGSDEVIYENGKFKVYLKQEETLKMDVGEFEFETKIKLKNDTVIPSGIRMINVKRAIDKEVI